MSWRTRLSIEYTAHHQLPFPNITQANKKQYYQSTFSRPPRIFATRTLTFGVKNYGRPWLPTIVPEFEDLFVVKNGGNTARQQDFSEGSKGLLAWGVNSKASICLFTDQKSLSCSFAFLDRSRKNGHKSHFWTSHTAQQNYTNHSQVVEHICFLSHLFSLLSTLGSFVSYCYWSELDFCLCHFMA